MQQTCRISGELFTVDEWELRFLEAMAPSFAGERYSLPVPDMAPTERFRRRFALRNLRTLYRRSCPVTGKAMISPYDPSGPHLVYHPDAWWSDSWDGRSFGREFDFSRPFFEQFHELTLAVPTMAYLQHANENCDFINGAAHCKDCYLAFNMDYAEEVLYSENVIRSRTCLDCLSITDCELCCECVDCQNCYHLLHSNRCVGCSDSAFLQECRQCRSCIGCTNLVNKEYHVFNQPVGREAYEQAWRKLHSRRELDSLAVEASAAHRGFPRKYYFGHSNEDFSGDCIHHVKNCYDCYEAFEIENCRHCYYLFQASNCVDVSIFGDHSEWLYNCHATGINCSSTMFCSACWSGSSHNLYSWFLHNSSHCFGCASLRSARHCILNKQFTASEYERLAGRIVCHMQETGEWGQFFPPSLSPFAVNETVSAVLAPLEKDEAVRRGYRWRDLPAARTSSAMLDLPDMIETADEAICGKEFSCRTTGRACQITRKELELRQRIGIALSVDSPEARHQRRLTQKPLPQLWDRTCTETGAALQTVYTPESGVAVVSEAAWREIAA